MITYKLSKSGKSIVLLADRGIRKQDNGTWVLSECVEFRNERDAQWISTLLDTLDSMSNKPWNAPIENDLTIRHYDIVKDALKGWMLGGQDYWDISDARLSIKLLIDSYVKIMTDCGAKRKTLKTSQY